MLDFKETALESISIVTNFTGDQNVVTGEEDSDHWSEKVNGFVKNGVNKVSKVNFYRVMVLIFTDHSVGEVCFVKNQKIIKMVKSDEAAKELGNKTN